MDKGTAVFIPSTFARGGFPNERVFTLRARNGELHGVADAQYCYTPDGRPLGGEPPENQKVEGLLLGLVLRMVDSDSVRVHLPDGEVYDLDQGAIQPARRAARGHVSIES